MRRFGLLYIGVADGGSGGDPLNLAQNLKAGFGKIMRIDPLGSNSANGEYGIPADNPFANDSDDTILAEIYAYGVRNPQHFAWDSSNGNMFFTEIGQSIVEEISLVTAGANFGWNDWEGSFEFISRSEVKLTNQRGDPGVTYPVAEYDHRDPLLQRRSAATGVFVYRGSAIPQLANRVLWGDLPSGEIFYFDADHLPSGGQAAVRRVLLLRDGVGKTLLQLIQEKNRQQGKEAAVRVDLRLGAGPDGRVFIMNKHDGTIRLLVPRQLAPWRRRVLRSASPRCPAGSERTERSCRHLQSCWPVPGKPGRRRRFARPSARGRSETDPASYARRP